MLFICASISPEDGQYLDLFGYIFDGHDNDDDGNFTNIIPFSLKKVVLTKETCIDCSAFAYHGGNVLYNGKYYTVKNGVVV